MNQLTSKVVDWTISRLSGKAQILLTRYGLFAVARLGLRRVPVVLLRGATNQSGQRGTLLVAGHDPWANYLPSRFFVGKPQRELVGNVLPRHLPALLDRMRAAADMTIVRMDRLSARLWFGRDYLAVPEWVGTRLTVPDDLDALVRSSSNIQRDVRRIRTRRYRSVLSTGDEDFDLFYDRFYLPLSKARYQELLVVRTADDLRRRARRGGILWAQREGRAVSALLFETKGGSLDVLAVGARDGDLALVKEGAIAALYFFVIDMARRGGHRTIDFRGSRPSLSDGVLRYKSKWGATLYDKADSYHDLFIRWGRATDTVTNFLSHTPLIFREDGGFSALIGTVPNEHELWVGGLRRWYRFCRGGCQEIPPAERRSVHPAAESGFATHAGLKDAYDD
jgi:hypothetical protein